MAVDIAIPAPPVKTGRQRTLSAKQQAIATQHAQKEDAARKRALTEAVRAEQRREEGRGFQRPQGEELNEDDDLDYESEDDGDHSKTNETFTSVSIVPTSEIKKTPAPVHPRKRLVRRVMNGAPLAQPVVMHTGDVEQFQRNGDQGPATSIRRSTSVAHNPPPKAYYGRGDGTFYSSHDEIQDNELVLGSSEVQNHKRAVYCYPDAHPDLEHFPRSTTAGATSSTSGDSSPTPSKPPPTVNQRIRKEAPTTTSAETTVVIKRPKTETSGSRGRVHASDFDDLTKSLIEETIAIYRAQIGAREPFPERMDDRDIVKQGWIEVCTTRHVRVELEESIFKLITGRASQARGQAKTISKPYVVTMYGLDSDASKRDVRNKVEELLDGSRFIYKDAENKTGIYRTPIIQLLVNKIFFRNKTDDGVTNPEFAEDNKLPIVTIALILTIVENNLDEWATGEHVDVPFTANAYKQKYQAHLKRLAEFDEKTRKADIVPRLCKHLLKMARKHAKVTESAVGSPEAGQLLDADVEAAKKEWEDLVLSEEE